MAINNSIPLIYISGWKGSGRGSSSYIWLERYFQNTECYAAGGQTDVGKMVSDLRELIADHHTEVISTNAPVMIPGGAHRLTDAQRDHYLLPLLSSLTK